LAQVSTGFRFAERRFLRVALRRMPPATCPAKNDRFQDIFSPLPQIAIVFMLPKKPDIMLRRNHIPGTQSYNLLRKITNYPLLMLFTVVLKEPQANSLEEIEALFPLMDHDGSQRFNAQAIRPRSDPCGECCPRIPCPHTSSPGQTCCHNTSLTCRATSATCSFPSFGPPGRR